MKQNSSAGNTNNFSLFNSGQNMNNVNFNLL
jgi:hypothetical protein